MEFNYKGEAAMGSNTLFKYKYNNIIVVALFWKLYPCSKLSLYT